MLLVRSLLGAAVVTMTLSCGRADSRITPDDGRPAVIRPATDTAHRAGVPATADTGHPTVVAATGVATAQVADTAIVRGPGVPTDSDDTASTRYGKHETPRRIASPDCRPRGIALCLLDTATTVFSVNCCIADQRQTNWLVFATARDSMQLFLESPNEKYLTMSPPSAAGVGAETSRSVDAWWMRARFPAAGTYVFTASIESDSPSPYELRIASVIATGASQPIGTSAGLTLTAPRKTRIAIGPQSVDAARAGYGSFAAVRGAAWSLSRSARPRHALCRLPIALHPPDSFRAASGSVRYRDSLGILGARAAGRWGHS